MNTVKSRLFSLADLKEFISLDVEEDYPKMLKKKKKLADMGPERSQYYLKNHGEKIFFSKLKENIYIP